MAGCPSARLIISASIRDRQLWLPGEGEEEEIGWEIEYGEDKKGTLERGNGKPYMGRKLGEERVRRRDEERIKEDRKGNR